MLPRVYRPNSNGDLPKAIITITTSDIEALCIPHVWVLWTPLVGDPPDGASRARQLHVAGWSFVELKPTLLL